MLGLTVKTEDLTKKVKAAASDATFKNFAHAAASLSKDVKADLKTAEGPSPAGSPPHTHTGAHLRRAIRYAADKDGAVIGPMESIVGESAAAHEFGGTFRGHDYDERPFMRPALERAAPRFADSWKGSIGE